MKFLLRRLSHRLKSHPITTNMILCSFIGFCGDVMCQTVYEPFTKYRPPLRREDLPMESASSSLLISVTSPYLAWQAWRRKTKKVNKHRTSSKNEVGNATSVHSSTKVLVDLRRSFIFCSFPLVCGVPFFLWVYRVLDKHISPHGITKAQALYKGFLGWCMIQFINPVFLTYVTALDHFFIFRDGRDGRRRVSQISHHSHHGALSSRNRSMMRFHTLNSETTDAAESSLRNLEELEEEEQEWRQLPLEQQEEQEEFTKSKSIGAKTSTGIRTMSNYLNVGGWKSKPRERVVLAGEDDIDSMEDDNKNNNNNDVGKVDYCNSDKNENAMSNVNAVQSSELALQQETSNTITTEKNYISRHNNKGNTGSTTLEKVNKSNTQQRQTPKVQTNNSHALFELHFPLHDSERELNDVTIHKMGYFYRIVDNRRFNIHEYKNCVREDVESKLYNDLPDIMLYGLAFWSLNWLPMFYYIPGHLRIAYSSGVQVVWSGVMSYLLHRKEGYETEQHTQQ